MYLLFDIGGSKMRLAISSDGETLGDTQIVSTPQNFEEGINLFKKITEALTGSEKIKACVGGIRRLDPTKSMLISDFRLPDWSQKPLKQKLEQITRSSVYLENDAALVGLGEATSGAGRGYKIVAYLTISTGVGGVRIVDGKIDENKYGFEPGHQVIDMDWSKFPDLKSLEEEGYGQLEAYISGSSLEKRFSKKPNEIMDEKVWQEIEKITANALKNITLLWSPDVIILGGGMLGSPGISIDDVKKNMTEILTILPNIPEIKKAELGDIGGLHGALHFLTKIIS